MASPSPPAAGAFAVRLRQPRPAENSEDDAGDLEVRRNPRPIVAFGYGAHHCLGAAAARLQAQVALEELLPDAPRFSVDAPGGEFAPGHFVRRYQSLPFDPEGLA